jgi:hypothetical protein
MEIFLDGGLFELIIAVSICYMLNFIFLRKYLFYLFCLLSVVSAICLFFIHSGDAYYLCVSLCLLNSFLLVFMLWRQRTKFPGENLFDVEALKHKFLKKKAKDTATGTNHTEGIARQVME